MAFEKAAKTLGIAAASVIVFTGAAEAANNPVNKVCGWSWFERFTCVASAVGMAVGALSDEDEPRDYDHRGRRKQELPPVPEVHPDRRSPAGA